MSNYQNKTAILNLLGIVIVVCMFLIVRHLVKLLGKKNIPLDNKGRNEAGRGFRKTVESRVIP